MTIARTGVHRREALRLGGLAALGVGLAACGRSSGGGSATVSPSAPATPGTALDRSAAVRAVADTTARPDAVASVQAFTADLYRRFGAESGNLVSSPYSVAVALAMSRNGARGATATGMDTVLHSPGANQLNAGLNALTQLVSSRSGARRNASGTRTTVTLDVANSLWGQQGEKWVPAFLDVLARDYGAGMNSVDYESALTAARTAINTWTSQHTHGKIPKLIPAGVLDILTRLVLVNAIYLKAPWATAFDEARTKPQPFVRAGGSSVRVPMMSLKAESMGYSAGTGWQAVDVPYAGNELAMALVLPGTGGLTALEKSLDGPGLARLLGGFAPSAVDLSMPKWTARTAFSLKDALSALGMATAFDPAAADFSGMTTQDRLHISAVLHQGWISVDEQGTEAAAATAVVMGITAGRPASEIREMVFDRPFLYVIHDVATATPLFIGRVADPSVAAA